MKKRILSFGMFLALFTIVACGDDGDDNTNWWCNCTGMDTTAICAEDYYDATAQANAILCEGREGCGCDCMDVLTGC